MDRAEFNKMMGEAELEAPTSDWSPPEPPLWAKYTTIAWSTDSGVRVGFDLGNSISDQPLLTLTPPGQATLPVAGFRDWSMAVATLAHLFALFPQSQTDEWEVQKEWVMAVHAEALRREVALRDAGESNPNG